jgi:hypothetical protein
MLKDPTGTIAPILVVRDIDKALYTYTTVFGFTRLRYFDGNDEYVPLGRDAAQVHVMKGERANPNHVNAGHVADVFVWVDDLDSLVTAARDAGLPITRAPSGTTAPRWRRLRSS